MEYKAIGQVHSLQLDKDELITLVALVHEGLDNIEAKSVAGNDLAVLKYESAQTFVNELNEKIMRR